MNVRELQCESCGRTFTCGEGGRDGGCWCMDLPPILPLPGNPSSTDGDCLCPDCLKFRLRTASSHDSSSGN